MTLDNLKSLFKWNSIPNCPGRFILTTANKYHSISDLVLISTIVDGGIISYKMSDGSYLHTLNTESGFQRKLNDLGMKE